MSDKKKSVGQPLKFGSVSELEGEIENYFEDCKEKLLPLTITGLAIALGTSRQTLMNYENREEYFDTIKRAKTIVENFAEIRLFGDASPTGAIFALKNFGWKDKSEVENTGDSNTRIVYIEAKEKEDIEAHINDIVEDGN